MSFTSENHSSKATLSYINIATADFFWSVFAWYTFLHCFSFNPHMSLYLKQVSYRQHRVESYFLSSLTKLSIKLPLGSFLFVLWSHPSLDPFLLSRDFFWMEFFVFVLFLSIHSMGFPGGSKFSKPGFNSMWTMNFQMFKLDLEKAEEPEIKLLTSAGSSKKQESSRKHLLLLCCLHQSLWLCGSQ